MSNKNHPDWEIKTRNIYVILFEESKNFFLNDTTQKNLWKVYDEHYRERHACTRELFVESKKQMNLPPIFLLDAIEGTSSDAFQRCILWSKYFVEHGYTCLAGTQMVECVDQFNVEETYYQSIKDISIEEICSKDKNLFPNFRQKKSKTPAEKQNRRDCVRLELVLHRNEYEKYKRIAEEYGVSLTEFFLHCARHGGVMNVDLVFIDQYIRKIEDYSNTLDGIISTILLSREYFPAEMNRVYELSHNVIESNNEVKKEFMRFLRQIRRMNNW